MDGHATLTTDVIVAGAGMGGLTAARTAQETGARVVVLEKAPKTGGSAAASGGTCWMANDLPTWLTVHPGADPALGKALVDSFFEGAAWLPSQGVVSERQAGSPDAEKFPRTVFAFKPDAAAVLEGLAGRITAGGGTILVSTALRDLELDDRGAMAGIRALGPDGWIQVAAPAVVLATGGWQGSQEMRARYLGRWADGMVLRANAYSTGEGFLAALRVGAGSAGPFARFYGHMMPAPPAEVGLHNFAQVKPTFSDYSVFVNIHGERFDDEWLGDEVTVHAVIQQDEGLCFLVWDEGIRRRHCQVPANAKPGADRLKNIQDAGAEILAAPTLDALATQMQQRWGVRRAALVRTLDAYNAAARAGSDVTLPIPRTGGLEAIETAPFYGLRCVPGITFTYGGARVSRRGQVLDTTGKPIPGLYAAGADCGGVYTRGYTGGLGLGLAFGRISGKEAAAFAAARTPEAVGVR